MRKLAAVAILGWYFLFQHDYLGKYLVYGFIGAFESADKCNTEREMVHKIMVAAERTGNVGQCFERTTI